MSQLFKIHAIEMEAKRIRRAGPECVSYGVWNAILSWQFPVVDGYITRPQDQHTSQSGQKGYSDLHTFHYPDGENKADKFLITQCKRKGLEGRKSVWTEGAEQLRQYLSATHKTHPVKSRKLVYGIVTVGKYMRVYKYSDAQRDVVDWAPHGVKKGAFLDILNKTDQPKITKILDYIRDNH
ncbi:uncharacterized protein N7479_010521 [Penicillium vulpinum]|uniref:Fungal-type protein kinase domain-containing protein n=1 Tax=Penicillium vulpinum TaxID=29845 RepID=A0A1V6S8G9_9EURO|nr:uncharacterized protein N7479_010521 [Penicillium vulpinum]KAJ5952108.1 hypothetical protein N7479_010521 [Penicillium vulpinum]OQE10166.1 hypothetical protein PENVUL_c004G04551 [Penicillium vulpinum]